MECILKWLPANACSWKLLLSIHSITHCEHDHKLSIQGAKHIIVLQTNSPTVTYQEITMDK